MGAIRILLPALLAINGLVNASSFSDLSSCGQGCINNMRESTPCVPVTDECLCENSDFQAGIRDCANQACAASDATAAIDYASGFCMSVTGVASTTAPATSTTEAATSTAAPTTTEAAVESTTTPATSSAEPTTSATSSDSAESSATSAASTDASSSDASSTASSASETSSAASGTASGTSTDSETSSSSASASSSSSSAAAAGAKPSSNGLSVAAKAGVAVGAGAAGVALLALVIAMCKSRRNRRPLPRGTMQISEPLPGSGRIDYSVPNQQMTAGSKLSTAFNFGGGGLNDNARPYEEMVPRVKPKQMV